MGESILLSLAVTRFKSFEQRQEIALTPLTVVLGRNNSGKSSLIQSLLLLKQTLAEPRSEVPLHLDGMVSAYNLRELTYGWPPAGERVPGPTFEVTWESDVDFEVVMASLKQPSRSNLAKLSGLPWIEKLEYEPLRLHTALTIETAEAGATTQISGVRLESLDIQGDPAFHAELSDGRWQAYWKGEAASNIEIEFDHFIPYPKIYRKLAPRDPQRTWYNAFQIVFAQPLEALKRLLAGFQYLGSTRSLPPSLYKPANVAPQEIGVSGELAAQLLHRRQHDLVHYLEPLDVSGDGIAVPTTVRERPLVDAVNDVLRSLSVGAQVNVEDIKEVGFRLMFGSASLLHVGRGLTYLLPLIELGLFADPLRFQSLGGDTPLEEYTRRCASHAHIAVEEPEAHLHPKVQTRLAEWLVSLALANRRLIVETHSDHLVRRLRGLAARAGAGSELERWLLDNVTILEVEQDEQGRSIVRSSQLDATGGFKERWPSDFMDEASDEESAIYYASLAKERAEFAHSEPLIIHDEGAEPEPETDQ